MQSLVKKYIIITQSNNTQIATRLLHNLQSTIGYGINYKRSVTGVK